MNCRFGGGKMSYEAYLIHHKVPILANEIQFKDGGVILIKDKKQYFVPYYNINFIRSNRDFPTE